MKILTIEEVLEPKNWTKSENSLQMECFYQKDADTIKHLTLPVNRLLYYHEKKGGEKGILFLIEKELEENE